MRFFIAILLCLPLHVLAHGDAHERMEHLDAQILREPNNAELHLRRGRLYTEEHHFEEARADFEKVLALAPTNHGARYFLAEALLYGGKAELAEQHAQKFVDAHGTREPGALSRGYWLLGQARMGRQHPQEAVVAYRKAMKVTLEPTPDHYQLFIEACLAAKGNYLDEALRVLDHGLAAGGSVDLLQGMALDVELQAGRPDAALQRLSILIAHGKRLPFLHTRKAEILADAGRMAEAGKTLVSARSALTTVSGKRRRAKAYTDLEQKIAAIETRVNTHHTNTLAKPAEQMK